MNANPPGLLRTPQGFYVLKVDSHLSRWCETAGRLDIAEPQIAHYAKYIPVGGTVVDAGASLGDHVCTYAKLVGPTGEVIAIEPNPLAYEALTLNFARWTNVLPLNIALAEDTHKGRFVASPNAGASYVESDENGDTRCQPLDVLLAFPMERLDFLHLDVEGGERSAILGARAVIAKFRPVIVLEINHECLHRYGLVEEDVLTTLAEIGYEWRELEKGHGPHLGQRDILALPI